MTPKSHNITICTGESGGTPHTFRLEVDIFDLLSARHELGVNIEFSTSSGDQMAVLWIGLSQAHRQPEYVIPENQNQE